MDIPWLTPDQHAAVVAWACRHGPAWKERLRAAWSRLDCPEGLVLREMRDNRLGSQAFSSETPVLGLHRLHLIRCKRPGVDRENLPR